MAIRHPQKNTSEHIKNPKEKEIQTPIFTFMYILEGDYGINSGKASKDLKAMVLHALHNYSKRTWDSFVGNRRNTGVENVAYTNLRKRKVNLPDNTFYNRIKKLTIFRVSHNNARLVCYREGNFSHILWIDWDLTSYDHGS